MDPRPVDRCGAGLRRGPGLGYLLLGGASPLVIAAIQAFAAGAIITMLADTMMPEAFEHGGNSVGVITALGFTLAFLLSEASG